MILTLTINPAIDRNVTADRLVFEDRAYITSTNESAGGRGLNAASVIQSFGGKTLAIATCGGATGKRMEELLHGSGFPIELVQIHSDIRINLTITDRQGLTIKLNELGPPIQKDELERLEKTVQSKLQDASWLMLCGSVPPGVPTDFYARMVDLARKKKVKTLIDTDGDALREGIEAKPTVVTPNQAEAERLLGAALLTRAHFLDAARKVHTMGAQSVVLSLGSRGAIGLAGSRVFEVLPPRVDAVCPIGAGDAMAAAFTWAMDNGDEFSNSLRWGVAAGTASAQLPGMNFATLEQTQKLYKQVEVRPV
ncbi:MAG: 1-phosphofructokinase family hexose kinase [Bryobacteraceae bacterium]